MHPLFSYSDFEIKLEFDERSGPRGRFEARVVCRLVGDLGNPERRTADLTPFGPLLEKLNKPHIGRSDLVDSLGEKLGQLLFPGRVRDLFGAAYRMLGASEALRVRIECLGESISGLPWEYTSVELADVAPGQLALNPRVSIVRHEVLDRARPSPRQRSELVVVSLDAGVVEGYPPLPPELPRTPDSLGRRQVRHIVVPAATRESLEATLYRQKVDIFHFSGHGEASRPGSFAGLVLRYEDDDGADILTGQELAPMLRKAGVSLAVLSGCRTGSRAPRTDGGGVAQALVESGVPIVVAMQHPVGDTQAKAFNQVFYDSLFSGETVDQAVSRGRQGMTDYGSPVLYHRSDSGAFLTPIAADTAEAAEPPDEKPRLAASPSVVSPKVPIAAETEAERAEPAGSWSQLSRRARSWRIEPGGRGPSLMLLRHALESLQGPTDDRLIAVSPDCGSVVQWTAGTCVVAWINPIVPRLVPWPRPFGLLDEDGAALLAITTAGGDEVKAVLTTTTRTYEVRLSQRDPADIGTLVDQPSRAAVYLGSTACTVDAHGRIRNHLLSRKLPPLAEVVAVDAARSGGDTLVGALGLTLGDGMPVLAAASDAGYPYLEVLAGPATSLVVMRQLDPSVAPDCIVTAAGTAVTSHKIAASTTR
ncbi:MAG: CHAT domain-containing protein [Pseudonocardiaceae bacterium]